MGTGYCRFGGMLDRNGGGIEPDMAEILVGLEVTNIAADFDPPSSCCCCCWWEEEESRSEKEELTGRLPEF